MLEITPELTKLTKRVRSLQGLIPLRHVNVREFPEDMKKYGFYHAFSSDDLRLIVAICTQQGLCSMCGDT